MSTPTMDMMLSKEIHPGDDKYLRAINALDALANDPDRLEREREQKFTRPPRVYRSPSLTTTECDDVGDPSTMTEEDKEREKLRELNNALLHELRQSWPCRQFSHESRQLFNEFRSLRVSGQYRYTRRFGRRLFDHARFLVKQRWIQQGIWKDAWNLEDRPIRGDTWKHEDALPPQPESESDDEPDNPPPVVEPPIAKPDNTTAPRPDPIVFGLFSGGLFSGAQLSDNHGFLRPMPPKEASPPIPPKKAPPRIKPFRDGPSEPLDRAASRPIHQFLAQLSYQREEILRELDEPPPDQDSRYWIHYDKDLHQRCQAARDQWFSDRPAHDDPAKMSFDINTIAYARLRERWQRREIWDDRWGVLPGMTWKHEEPFEKVLEERLQAATGKRPAEDNPGPFRPGWLKETAKELWGEEKIVARYGPLFSQAYELETYRGKMAESGITLDKPDQSLKTSRHKVYIGAAFLDQPPAPAKPSAPSASPPAPEVQEADARPATAIPVPEPIRAASPSPPVGQKQHRGGATRSSPQGDLATTPLKPVSPGRVSKNRKPAPPGGSEQVDRSGVPIVNYPVTPRRRSQRLQLASEERPDVEAREDPGRSGPVRRSTRSTVGAAARLGKKPVGVTKRGPPKSRGKRG